MNGQAGGGGLIGQVLDFLLENPVPLHQHLTEAIFLFGLELVDGALQLVDVLLGAGSNGPLRLAVVGSLACELCRSQGRHAASSCWDHENKHRVSLIQSLHRMSGALWILTLPLRRLGSVGGGRGWRHGPIHGDVGVDRRG